MKKEKQNQIVSAFGEEKNKKVKNFFVKPKGAAEKSGEKTGLVSYWKNKLKFKKKTILWVAGILIVAGLLVTSGYYYSQYKKATAGDAAKNETANYVAKISKFMILPTDEAPTMATVADKDKLSSKPFFASAQNGDKVLFYTKAQEAILYRPSQNKIVKAASMSGAVPGTSAQTTPISPDTQAAPQDQSQQVPTPPASSQPTSMQSADSSSSQNQSATPVAVAIYNGTKINGLAATLAEELSAIPEVTVISKTNAVGNYSDNTIVDLSGNHPDEAQKIAQTLSGSVGSLPDGEKKPDNVDILVIGGKE